MTHVRPEQFGPTWRKPNPAPLREDSALLLCCCGVQMEFDWPPGRDAVRCFGCGRRFPRPEHFEARERTPWKPPPLPERAQRTTRRRVLAWIVLAAIVGGAIVGAMNWAG